MTIKTLSEYIQKTNLVDDLGENDINEITSNILGGFEKDLQSRADWEEEYKNWIKLATQVKEHKTWPWKGASNVKYPLVATAAMQFAARAYPALVPDTKAVAMRVIGDDPQSEKRKRAERVAAHMSYQVLEQMEGWKNDMDRMCYILPIVGIAFKKTYYDYYKKKNCSILVYPKDFVVDYWTTNINDAYRKTHILYLNENEIKERQRKGLYISNDSYTPNTQYVSVTSLHEDTLNRQGNKTASIQHDSSTTIPILEIHSWWDLDGDEYAEPYIFTFDWAQKKLLRIVAGYRQEDIEHNGDEILCIKQLQYFTKFEFIPNPDGGFYSLGFGSLLGPINETVDTLINQTVDAGTQYNLQAGFISKGLRIRAGTSEFQPGEWKIVNPVGDDLKKGIFPLPTKEPSTVLFQMLGALIESGNKLASVAEIFVGEMPGQNTPATTTMATIEQGMKVFTAIYKRIYESLTQEFRKLYQLNKEYLSIEEEFIVLDSAELQKIGISDYQQGDETDIRPAGDPKASADATKLLRAQAIMELMKLGTIDPKWATIKLADAMSIDDIQEGLMQQPPPDPKAQEMQMKMQLEQQKAEMKAQVDAAKLQMDQAKAQNDITLKTKLAELDAQQKAMELKFKELELMFKVKEQQVTAAMDMQAKQNDQEQKSRQKDDEHKVKMKQLEEKEKSLGKRKKRTKIKESPDGTFEVIDEIEEDKDENKKDS